MLDIEKIIIDFQLPDPPVNLPDLGGVYRISDLKSLYSGCILGDILCFRPATTPIFPVD